MGKVVGAVFGGAKAPGIDPAMLAAQREQMEAANRREAELKAQEDARRRAIAGGAQGRVQLLAGPETGVAEPLKAKTGE